MISDTADTRAVCAGCASLQGVEAATELMRADGAGTVRCRANDLRPTLLCAPAGCGDSNSSATVLICAGAGSERCSELFWGASCSTDEPLGAAGSCLGLTGAMQEALAGPDSVLLAWAPIALRPQTCQTVRQLCALGAEVAHSACPGASGTGAPTAGSCHCQCVPQALH